jgi:hypothetical protein
MDNEDYYELLEPDQSLQQQEEAPSQTECSSMDITPETPLSPNPLHVSEEDEQNEPNQHNKQAHGRECHLTLGSADYMTTQGIPEQTKTMKCHT